jgi:hypothetical protein
VETLANHSSVDPDKIHFIGRAPSETNVEIKHLDLRSTAGNSKRQTDLLCWFNRTGQLCSGKSCKDGRVMVSMRDLRACAHLTTEQYQYDLRWLHGFLKQLRRDIPKTKTSAVSNYNTHILARMCANLVLFQYILVPRDSTRSLQARAWILYELDIEDPIMQFSVARARRHFGIMI